MSAAVAEVIAGPGHNNPPPSPREALAAHIDDLLTEARNWADGTEVTTEAQHDDLTRLIGDLLTADRDADAARKTEREPFDEQIEEIQCWYNVYIAPLKNKVPGSIPKSVAALRATAEKWRLKKLAEAEEAARLAREEAAVKAAAAAEAARAVDPTDLASVESVESLIFEAKAAARQAGKAEAATSSGTGLTTYYEAVLTDPRAAVLHYMTERRGEFIGLVEQLAAQDVRGGKRTIPGFSVEERKRVR